MAETPEGRRRPDDPGIDPPFGPPPGFMSKALDAMPTFVLGFMSKALDAMPTFVLGLVGSFLGLAMAIVIVMKMGGFESVVMRMANAYADGLEVQMKTLTIETGKLATINRSLEGIVVRLEALDTRVVAAEKRLGAIEERSTVTATKVDAVAGRVDEVKGKLDRLGKWACDHVDQLKTRPTAPDCGGQ